MEKYNVTGMSCAACSARVEKAVSSVEGVTACSVNLLTNSMTVEGSAAAETVISAVKAAGYGASLAGGERKESKASAELSDTETPRVKKRLIASVSLLLVLMYLSMGHTMLGLPLPRFMSENPMILGLSELLLAVMIMVINQKFFINGTLGILHKAPNMDTLVALGSFASFGYSVYVLFMMSNAQMAGDHALAHCYLHDLYFESAAMIVTLITVGKMLEARAKGKTTSAIEGLMKLAPKTATLIRGGGEVTVRVEDVRRGDIFAVRPGEQIPVDGIVTEGHSAVNEASLTGESIPAEKEIGSSVFSGTLNESGYLVCEATKTAEDSALAEIIKMVTNASATKAPIAKIADKVSGVFVPAVLAVSAVTLALWLIFGESIGFAFGRAISVLVISCPCALGLATPVAVMVGMGIGAKRGILLKTAIALEECGKVKTVVLDKTCTVTEGNPTVSGIFPAEELGETELLTIAYSIEKNSEHPLAKAVCKRAEENGISPSSVSDFAALPGNGVTAKVGCDVLFGGSLKFIETKANITEKMRGRAASLSEEGITPLLFAKNGEILGIIGVSDAIKSDSKSAVDSLRKMGIRVVMLTGDNERTAAAIAAAVGIDEVISGVLPDGKEAVIRDLQRSGKVAMVGDGINDAPALTRADVGIAIGAGADVAVDAADVVLVNSRLSDVPETVSLSRKTLRNIKQNLFWAFIYNVIGIPIAAGALYPAFGLKLSPMLGAAAMSLSSVTVVSNALRLNIVCNKIQKTKDKKEQKMKKTLKIEGMMCPHCEARVKKCLDEIPGVSESTVDHKSGTAVVTAESTVSDAVLKNAVEAQGYPVLEIN